MSLLICPDSGNGLGEIYAGWTGAIANDVIATLGYDVSGEVPEGGFLFDPEEIIARVEAASRWIGPELPYQRYYDELVAVAHEAKRLGVKVMMC